jgi:hypothetical protein
MANKELKVTVVNQLDEIIDLCVGNIPAEDIGVGQFSTIPEVLSKVESEPSNRDAVYTGLKYIEKLKSKIVFLETELVQLQRLQERGIIR